MGRFDKYINEGNENESKSRIRLIISIAFGIILIGILFVLIFLRPFSAPVQTTTETPTLTRANTPIPENNTEEPSPTATLSPMPSPTATSISTPTTQPTKTPTVTPTRTPTLTATPTKQSEDIITAICICFPMNAALFEGPDSTYPQTGVFITQDQEVEVLGRAESGSWIYVVTAEDESGWADARRFEISQDFEELPVYDDPDSPPFTFTPSVSTNPSQIAYWNEVSKESSNDGRWEVTLSLRVPNGGNYFFEMEGLSVTFRLDDEKPVENGFIFYIVTISGIGCPNPLVDNLIVRRNGQELEVRNQFTNVAGPLFVSPPSNC